MTLLLDTCTFLWLLSDDPRLPLRARTECRTPSNAVYLSALSVWEITIKYRLGRLPLLRIPGVVRRQPPPAAADRTSAVRRTGCGARHTAAAASSGSVRPRLGVASDPARPDDRDARPVDRMLSGPRALAVMVAAARTPTIMVWPGEGSSPRPLSPPLLPGVVLGRIGGGYSMTQWRPGETKS